MNPDFLFHFCEELGIPGFGASSEAVGSEMLMDYKTIKIEISCQSSDYLLQYFLFSPKLIQKQLLLLVSSD